MDIKEFIQKNKLLLSSIFIILIEFSILLYCGLLNQTFWYDEAYTIAIVKYPLKQIWNITAIDVHPPLYYFMLKIFTMIFGSSLFTMHLFSNLGVIATLLLGLFPIRRLLGIKTAFTFILLMVILPVNQYLGVEIRMYSWAMFFVLASSIYAYEAFFKRNIVCYSKMTFFAICDAYTHYYALVAVGSIFLLWGLISILKGKGVIRLILFGILFILAYSFWIPILFTQILEVKQSFWVEKLTLKDLLLFSYYFFSPKEPSHPYMIFSLEVMSIALSITLGLIACLFYSIMKKFKKQTNSKMLTATFFCLIYVLTILITLLITLLIKPISVPRFTTCVLGPLILGASIFSIQLYKSNKKNRVLLIIIFTMLAIFSTARFYSEKAYYEMKNTEESRIRNYIENNEATSIKTFMATLKSYPQLAQLSILFPEYKFLLYSPHDKTNYLPFKIKVINDIPEKDSFYLVEEPVNADQNSIMEGNEVNTDYGVISQIDEDRFVIKEMKLNN